MHRAAPAAPTRVSKAFSTKAAIMGRDRTKKHSIAVNGAWLPVPLEFMRSRACAELSPHAAKLLLDLMALLGPNATRNGDLSLAPKAMKARGWSGRETLFERIDKLDDWLTNHSDHRNADLSQELASIGALYDLAREWCADFDSEPAVLP